jgi:hypothetical protein
VSKTVAITANTPKAGEEDFRADSSTVSLSAGSPITSTIVATVIGAEDPWRHAMAGPQSTTTVNLYFREHGHWVVAQTLLPGGVAASLASLGPCVLSHPDHHDWRHLRAALWDLTEGPDEWLGGAVA